MISTGIALASRAARLADPHADLNPQALPPGYVVRFFQSDALSPQTDTSSPALWVSAGPSVAGNDLSSGTVSPDRTCPTCLGPCVRKAARSRTHECRPAGPALVGKLDS
jgi:hypothetical protein